MATHANQIDALSGQRISYLIAPREHGAWGLLFVPLVTGGAVGLLAGGDVVPLIAFTVAALGLFSIRTPLESWLGTGLFQARTHHERRIVGITILMIAAISFSALGFIFRHGRHRELLPLGAVAIVAFIAQGILRKLGRQTRMLSQVVGTLGLTVTAPAAYCLTAGLDRRAWALWIVNFLFAGNQIHFVQLRIHSARIGWKDRVDKGSWFLFGEVLLAGGLLLAWRFTLLPGLVALAFLPLLARGAAWIIEGQKPLLVRRLGWTELAHSAVFGACLVAGFRLGW
jgi:YwiC-like protein